MRDYSADYFRENKLLPYGPNKRGKVADVKRELSLEGITTHESVMNTITRWCTTGSVRDRTRSTSCQGKIQKPITSVLTVQWLKMMSRLLLETAKAGKAQEAEMDKKRKGKGESKSRKRVKTLRRWRKLMRTSIRSVVPIMMKMSFHDAWIGCDNNDCVRWFHCWCAGFDR